MCPFDQAERPIKIISASLVGMLRPLQPFLKPLQGEDDRRHEAEEEATAAAEEDSSAIPPPSLARPRLRRRRSEFLFLFSFSSFRQAGL